MPCSKCHSLTQIFKRLIQEHANLRGDQKIAEKAGNFIRARELAVQLTTSSKLIKLARKNLLDHEATHGKGEGIHGLTFGNSDPEWSS
jgi:hypothetical protein